MFSKNAMQSLVTGSPKHTEYVLNSVMVLNAILVTKGTILIDLGVNALVLMRGPTDNGFAGGARDQLSTLLYSVLR